MARQNGMWNVITMKLCPGAMGLRHFVPLAFVTSIIILSALAFVHAAFAFLLAAEIGLYLVMDCFFSFQRAENIKQFGLLIVLFPVFHVSYGWGSLKGLFMLMSKKYRNTDYVAPII